MYDYGRFIESPKQMLHTFAMKGNRKQYITVEWQTDDPDQSLDPLDSRMFILYS